MSFQSQYLPNLWFIRMAGNGELKHASDNDS
jgi:hypothetical protein